MEIPEKDHHDKEYFMKVMRAIDAERTQDLALHAWNLGHLHTKWDNWPPRTWSAFPESRKKKEEPKERYTYTFDFIGRPKFKAERNFLNDKIIQPFDPRSDMLFYTEGNDVTLDDELSVAFERIIDTTINKLNNYEKDLSIKRRFEAKFNQINIDAKCEVSDTSMSSDEEVPLEAADIEQFYSSYNTGTDLEYRRSTPEDIEMPKVQRLSVLKELDIVIDEMLDLRIKQMILADKDKEPPVMSWREVLHALFNVSSNSCSRELSSRVAHFPAKDNIWKLFSPKLMPPNKPAPDPYFDPNDDKLQTEDSETVLWKRNMNQLREYAEIENILNDLLETEREAKRISNRQETVVPLIDFNDSIKKEINQQNIRFAYRDSMVNELKEMEELSKVFFQGVKDSIKNDKKKIRSLEHEKDEVVINFKKKVFDKVEDPFKDNKELDFVRFKNSVNKYNISKKYREANRAKKNGLKKLPKLKIKSKHGIKMKKKRLVIN